MSKEHKVARFHYRCQRCAAEEFNPCTTEQNAFNCMIEIVGGGDTFRKSLMGGQMLTERTLHSCKDGGQGISHLVGYKVTEE